jgi:hypothetical protein
LIDMADVRRTARVPGGAEFVVEAWRPLDTLWDSPVAEILGRLGATPPQYRVTVRNAAGRMRKIVHQESFRTYEEALQRVEGLVDTIVQGQWRAGE